MMLWVCTCWPFCLHKKSASMQKKAIYRQSLHDVIASASGSSYTWSRCSWLPSKSTFYLIGLKWGSPPCIWRTPDTFWCQEVQLPWYPLTPPTTDLLGVRNSYFCATLLPLATVLRRTFLLLLQPTALRPYLIKINEGWLHRSGVGWIHMATLRPFLQLVTFLFKDKLGLNLSHKETSWKQTDLAPPANIPTSGMRLGLGSALTIQFWPARDWENRQTDSAGIREPEAIALAPVRDRGDIRALFGPLEGSQELARRSEAGSLVVLGPGSRQESIWNGRGESWLPARNLNHAQPQLLRKSSDLFHVMQPWDIATVFSVAARIKVMMDLKKKIESSDQHVSRSATCRKLGGQLKKGFPKIN